MYEERIESLSHALKILSSGGKVTSALVLGDFMLDSFVWGECERISPESPVPVVGVESESDCPGGAGNVVANLRGLGVEAWPIGVVGPDLAGRRLVEHLDRLGCPTEGVLQHGARTTEKIRVMAQGQQIVRVDRNTAGTIDAGTVDELLAHTRTALDRVDVCVIADYGKGVGVPSLLTRVLKMASERGIPAMVHPHGVHLQRVDCELYRGASCVIANLPQADEDAAERVAATIGDACGAPNVLVTRGAAGLTLLADDTLSHIEGTWGEVHDVSGVEETIIAAVTAAVAGGVSYLAAAHLADTAAASVIGRIGTVPIGLADLRVALEARSPLTNSKVTSWQELPHLLSRWRSQGKRVAFTNGCFDVLHLGHVSLLEKAAESGDVLVVALNSDDSVRRAKGEERPINDQNHRALVVAGLQATDAVVIFEEDTPEDLLRLVRPEVLVKGAEYNEEQVVGGSFVSSYGGDIVRVQMVEGYSTTKVVDRMRASADAGA